MRILVIDDEVEVAKVLIDALRSEGHEPIAAYGGREALAALKRHWPDAVFLDVAMPEVSGIDVLRWIRAVDPVLPVVLITGHARPGEIEEAQSLGVSEVIEKPHILTNLTGALAALRASRGGEGAE